MDDRWDMYKLSENLLDMVFLLKNHSLDSCFSSCTIGHLEIVCCASKNNPLAELTAVAPEDLKDVPLVLFENSFFQTEKIKKWFSEEEIEVMAQAVEDHRASNVHAPRSIYGRIVAEADRLIEPMQILRRTVQYGLSHYPELSKDLHYSRYCEHLHEKYAEGGYLKLWIPESENAAQLRALRRIIADESQCRSAFEQIYSEECK